ncbi:putative nuclease HARBI1 [Haliotis rubra]|uniref:putative nuclease HARBI1 n=1 Tax=Haliotis rubra TaxID=36100 RepID=UPI001EE5F477|nr:putative nuclease HARBI1 [Haliotis rubra]
MASCIPIQAPKKDEVAYMSRKGYHCINVQAVCDAKMRYACKSYLLTPLPSPNTASEERCLHRSSGCLLFQPERCINVIAACFQLHNIPISLKLPQPTEPLPQEDCEGDREDNNHCATHGGQAVMRHLIESRFSSK